MTNKYNFNPTPEQLAQPVWDFAPEQAQWFFPANKELLGHYIKQQGGIYFSLYEHSFGWRHSPKVRESIELAIKRPADPNALDKEIVEAFESYDEDNNLELFLTKDKYGYYIATSTAYHFEYFKAGYLAAMEKVK